MGLDAAVYVDDDNETAIASVRIGNVDGVLRLREAIKGTFPAANVLLTKVLHSAFHTGDVLQKDDLARSKIELRQLSAHCPDDAAVRAFVTEFGRLVTTALDNDRPITFTRGNRRTSRIQ